MTVMEIIKRLLVILDNEGPCTKNDNALELFIYFAKKFGFSEAIAVAFYTFLSVIDDNWGDFHKIRKDPNYSAGHTLKVILAFLKAMGATTKEMEEFSRESLLVVPNIDKTISALREKYEVCQISTSYEFFIRAFCELVGLPFHNAWCTEVGRFDEITMSGFERYQLLKFIETVGQMNPVKYNKKTGKVYKRHLANYRYVTRFIWNTLYNMEAGWFLKNVVPVGQLQKMEALIQVQRITGIPWEEIIFFGDSQTDAEGVKLTRKYGGVAVMFNGKGPVCAMSDIMCIGQDARAIAEVTEVFAEEGREGVIKYCTPQREAKHGGLLAAVTPQNIEKLEKRSVEMREIFRGVHIGKQT